MIRAAARLSVVLALLPALSGCIAAVAAIPTLTGGAVLGKATGLIRVATARPKPGKSGHYIERTTTTSIAPSADDTGFTAGNAAPSAAGTLARLGDVPDDADVMARLDPWIGFIGYAANQAKLAEGLDQPGHSVLLDPTGTLTVPKLRGCQSKTPPAVLIDLDSGTGMFAPRNVRPAPPGLVAGLRALREAGVVVAWITSAPASEVGAVAEALKTSGLDPDGVDPLLLARSVDDRKQVLRQQANRDVCVVAIAGDRKGDFDELFDYLRDPASAKALDSLIGQGWFLVPPPLG